MPPKKVRSSLASSSNGESGSESKQVMSSSSASFSKVLDKIKEECKPGDLYVEFTPTGLTKFRAILKSLICNQSNTYQIWLSFDDTKLWLYSPSSELPVTNEATLFIPNNFLHYSCNRLIGRWINIADVKQLITQLSSAQQLVVVDDRSSPEFDIETRMQQKADGRFEFVINGESLWYRQYIYDVTSNNVVGRDYEIQYTNSVTISSAAVKVLFNSLFADKQTGKNVYLEFKGNEMVLATTGALATQVINTAVFALPDAIEFPQEFKAYFLATNLKLFKSAADVGDTVIIHYNPPDPELNTILWFEFPLSPEGEQPMSSFSMFFASANADY